MAEDSGSIRRGRPWWFDSGWKALVVVYLPQLIVLFTGPLTECRHCVGEYFKFFAFVPGTTLVNTIGRKSSIDWPDWTDLGLVALVVAITLFAVMMIGGWLKGWMRWLFYLLIAILSGFNALSYAAILRA